MRQDKCSLAEFSNSAEIHLVCFVMDFTKMLQTLLYKATYDGLYTRPHTDGRDNHANCPSGAVRCLAQGHLDTELGGAGDRTSNLLVARPPALPPELSLLRIHGQRRDC